jgi:hypothetical protein
MSIRTTDLLWPGPAPRRVAEPTIRTDPRQLPLALPCPVHPDVALSVDPPALCPLCARESRHATYRKSREAGLSGALARGELKPR